MNVHIGTAPDNWGVWFSSDPKQTPWDRYLDEVVEAGYDCSELGPPGYLPVDPKVLERELSRRNLTACGTVVMRHLEDSGCWPVLRQDVLTMGAILQGLGAKYLVVIDDVYSNLFTGEFMLPKTLDSAGWQSLIATAHRVAELARSKFDLKVVFHPHAETHVEYEDQIEALLAQTDPALVSLCLDTGHHAYRGGEPVSFFRKHHARIPYLHLKSIDPAIRDRVQRDNIPFAIAVGMDMFCEPERGVVDFAAFRDALREVNYEGLAIVEQDMYPAPFDKPLPIAKRTRQYLRNIGIG
jgi:inosose dehydratase